MPNGRKKFIQNFMFHFSLAYAALLTLCNARQSGGDISHWRRVQNLWERRVYSVSIIQLQIYVMFVPVSGSRS